MGKEYFVKLTEEEWKRVITVLGCNIDLNMKPNMQKHGKLGNTASVLQVAKAIEFDQNIIQKFLDAPHA